MQAALATRGMHVDGAWIDAAGSVGHPIARAEAFTHSVAGSLLARATALRQAEVEGRAARQARVLRTALLLLTAFVGAAALRCRGWHAARSS